VLPVLLAVTLLLLWRHWQSPQARLSRIKVGTSAAEVDAILGRPADYTTDCDSPGSEPSCGKGRVLKIWWYFEEGWATVVWLDEDGNVTLAGGDSLPRRDGFREWLRRRLGL
jgi:hypothetical protein